MTCCACSGIHDIHNRSLLPVSFVYIPLISYRYVCFDILKCCSRLAAHTVSSLLQVSFTGLFWRFVLLQSSCRAHCVISFTGLFYRSLSQVSFGGLFWRFVLVQSSCCARCVISFTGLFYRSLLTFCACAVELLRTLCHLCGDTLEINEYKRLTPLTVAQVCTCVNDVILI